MDTKVNFPNDIPLTNAKEFRRLARSRLLNAPPAGRAGGSGDDDLNPGDVRPERELRPAAVLIPIVARPALTVILTERTAHLTAHAGQIAFPGGKIEAADEGPLGAALRETEEEIGLPHDRVEVLGYLDCYRTGTGYIISPVVGIVQPDSSFKPDPAEVAAVFEVPLGFLMEAANHRIDSRLWRGAERRFYAMPYEQHYIWGATAGIIRMLQQRLFGE